METNDYKKFKFYKWNRNINPANVNDKVKLISEFGWDKSQSILVSKDFEIGDGQHRFLACKELGLPIVYKIDGDLTEERVKRLNSTSKRWVLNDFIDSNAKKGIKEYNYLSDVIKKYKISQSCAVVVVPKIELKANEMRNGKSFDIDQNAVAILEFLLNAKKTCSFWQSAYFTRAVKHLFNKVNKSDISRISELISTIPQATSTIAYLTIFENILNRWRRDDKKVKLT
jgi:hypothetical protein